MEASIFESALSVIDAVKSVNPTLGHYRELLVILEHRSLLNDLNIPKQSVVSFFQHPQRLIDIQQMEDVLVRKIIETGTGSDLANRLNIVEQVHARVLRELLANCWDSDIDPFIQGLSSKTISEIIVDIVEKRIAVVVQRLCEDTSRLHGIMIARVASNPELKRLLLLEVSDETIVNSVSDWLCSDERSVLEIAESCRRLLFHPTMPREVDSLLTCISAINSLI